MESLRPFFSLSPKAEPDARPVAISNPLIITSPRIGFLNLLGASAQPILEADKLALQPFFTSTEESSAVPPVCDVLMIYASLDSDGRISGVEDGLRDMIRKATASIVVVAKENESKS